MLGGVSHTNFRFRARPKQSSRGTGRPSQKLARRTGVTHWGSTAPPDPRSFSRAVANCLQGNPAPFFAAIARRSLFVPLSFAERFPPRSAHPSQKAKNKFKCRKGDGTAVEPATGTASGTAPEGGKALSLSKAIHPLKPDADAKAEAKPADKRAREDIKDATS